MGLLPLLDMKLMSLLKSLTPADWQKQTVAKLWAVKDVAAHLLDGNIRVLSMLRDGYAGKKPEINSHAELVNFLNGLNADWVKAIERVSPAMLILLHEVTGHLYCDYYGSLDPFEKSPWAVDWAGEKESLNWMHIAREYTEKWLHQQQIRDALDDNELMTKQFFYPFINIFMLALPYTYRDVSADDGTVIRVSISGDIGGVWHLMRMNGKWILDKNDHLNPASELIIDAGASWKLFSKSVRPEAVKDKIQINGDQGLGEIALSMVSVMA